MPTSRDKSTVRRSARRLRDTERARQLVVLATRVKRLRAARGLSQREAARLIGVGPLTLRRLELGTGNSSLAVLLSVARTFGVTLGHLFGRRGKSE
jgi:transcriptional regulator with XRE-family HTH domain